MVTYDTQNFPRSSLFVHVSLHFLSSCYKIVMSASYDNCYLATLTVEYI